MSLTRKLKTKNNKLRTLGILFIVSAPSGAGKTTLCRMARDFFSDLHYGISYTTRPPRKNETDGIDYHFVTDDVFKQMFKNREFLECAEVHGFRYGTSEKDIDSLLKKGCNVILDIDVQGARQVRERTGVQYSSVFIFVLPPSMKACKERLKSRGKDDKETIEKRIINAKKEIKESIQYDYIIINDDLNDAFEMLKSVIAAERSKKERMERLVKEIYKEVF